MIQAVIGTKIRQSRLFTEEGVSIPVTYVRVEPQVVVQVKTKDRDGYTAAQVGVGSRKAHRISQPLKGHLKAAGIKDRLPRHLREVSMDEGATLERGSALSITDILGVGDTIQVVGVSKGKGFAGVVKRHGFRGGPRTHGQSDRERAPGSLGQTTTPGRVYKGKRMAGRMGNDRVTIKNLRVVAVDGEKQEVVISGLVPGARNSVVMIEKKR